MKTEIRETSSRGLLITTRGHRVELKLDRPARLNALDRDLMRETLAAIDVAARDPDIYLVTITGSGSRAFCAGADLKELSADGDLPLRPMQGTQRNLFEAILECPKPTVAVVNGDAFGAGCELAMACDLRLASNDARFAMPEAKVGMGGNFGAQMLTRLIPRAIAMEMLFLGDPISAVDALRLGLANRVVPANELAAAADALVDNLLQSAPLTLQHYKAAILAGRDLPLSHALRLRVRPDPYDSRDRREGVSAFNERRTPRWEGR